MSRGDGLAVPLPDRGRVVTRWPIPIVVTMKNQMFAAPVAASTSADTRPTMAVSTTPMNMRPTCTVATGAASESSDLKSARVGRNMAGRT